VLLLLLGLVWVGLLARSRALRCDEAYCCDVAEGAARGLVLLMLMREAAACADAGASVAVVLMRDRGAVAVLLAGVDRGARGGAFRLFCRPRCVLCLARQLQAAISRLVPIHLPTGLPFQ
jgi:hypothetical protein